MSNGVSNRRMLKAFAACFHEDLDLEIAEIYGGNAERWLDGVLSGQFGIGWYARGFEAGGWTIDRPQLKREIAALLRENASDVALSRAWVRLGGASSFPGLGLRESLRAVAESL